MSRIKITQFAVIGIVSGMLFFSGCTRSEQAFVTGAVAGAVVMGVFDHPRYYDRPYYYYNDQYYYGGRYQNGYYLYNGKRLHGGDYHEKYDKDHHDHHDHDEDHEVHHHD